MTTGLMHLTADLTRSEFGIPTEALEQLAREREAKVRADRLVDTLLNDVCVKTDSELVFVLQQAMWAVSEQWTRHKRTYPAVPRMRAILDADGTEALFLALARAAKEARELRENLLDRR